MKCNPKNSILKINVVKILYVESCYKHFTSKYRKLNCNINISNIPDLPFDVMCFHLKNDVDDTVPNEPTINIFLKINCE